MPCWSSILLIKNVTYGDHKKKKGQPFFNGIRISTGMESCKRGCNEDPCMEGIIAVDKWNKEREQEVQ